MPGQRLPSTPCRRLGLPQVPVAVRQLVGEVGLVEVRDPHRVVPGVRVGLLQRVHRAPGRHLCRPRVAQQRVPPGLRRVEHRLRARSDPPARPLLRRARQLRDLPRVSELRGEVAHGRGEDVPAVPAVARRLREPQRLDVVALGEAGLAGVDGHVAREFGQSGHRGEQVPAHRLPVGAGQQPGDHAVEVVHDDRAHVPAAVLVVQVAERLGHRAHRRHVGLAHPRPRRPRHLRVGRGDQPVPARLDQRGRGHGGAGQEVPAAHVAAPQLADLLDGAQDRRGELEADSGGEVLAVGHADLVDRDRTAEFAAERLRDDRRCAAPWLLSAQPARHGRLVVPQVETVLGAAHVDPAGEPRVGAARFLDERLQPFVRLPRDERPCGHGVPPVAAVPAHAPS